MQSIVTLALCALTLAPIPKVDQEPMQPRIRYTNESKDKSNGVIYTPTAMAVALASEMIDRYPGKMPGRVSVLDPAVGKAELLFAIVRCLKQRFPKIEIRIVGYDIDAASCKLSEKALRAEFPFSDIDIRCGDFLDEASDSTEKFDFVIANPPYIRTQILGSDKAQDIAMRVGLSGRVDIYYAFLVITAKVLSFNGVAGYITSNKFLSIKSGATVRKFMMENYALYSLVDYGDTKVFEKAAVLPCTIVFGLGRTDDCSKVSFTTIYQNNKTNGATDCDSIFDNLHRAGKYRLQDGRVFDLKTGTLNPCKPGDIWTLSSAETSEWLRSIDSNTWLHLSDLGKIKVGIKTTADNVFIGDNWGDDGIELLRPLVTHRDAGKITASTNCHWRVLYPHGTKDGKRCVVDLDRYPKSKRYLERHRAQLAGRRYIHEAGREWYEIWVPQNPDSWQHRKIVFRDISETPQFWFDNSGSVVNGDCYWIDIAATVPDDMVYLALAVANSTFIERYYDTRFNTKLYSGKRRFMAQFVEQFPLPTTNSVPSQKAISIIRDIVSENRRATLAELDEINVLVDEMFAVP